MNDTPNVNLKQVFVSRAKLRRAAISQAERSGESILTLLRRGGQLSLEIIQPEKVRHLTEQGLKAMKRRFEEYVVTSKGEASPLPDNHPMLDWNNWVRCAEELITWAPYRDKLQQATTDQRIERGKAATSRWERKLSPAEKRRREKKRQRFFRRVTKESAPLPRGFSALRVRVLGRSRIFTPSLRVHISEGTGRVSVAVLSSDGGSSPGLGGGGSPGDDSGGSEPPQGDPDLPSRPLIGGYPLVFASQPDRILPSWRPARPGLMSHVLLRGWSR